MASNLPAHRLLFVGLNWFFLSYLAGHLVLFLRFGQGGIEGFVQQMLFINVTHELGQLMLAYAGVLTIVSIFALIVIQSSAWRTSVLVGGTLMGAVLGMFAYGMSVYFYKQPCPTPGCADLELNTLIVLVLYLIYGIFIVPQVPMSWAMRTPSKSMREFETRTLAPGIIALASFIALGLMVAFRVS